MTFKIHFCIFGGGRGWQVILCFALNDIYLCSACGFFVYARFGQLKMWPYYIQLYTINADFPDVDNHLSHQGAGLSPTASNRYTSWKPSVYNIISLIPYRT